MKIKKRLLAIALVASMLCMNTRAASAEVKETSVCGYDVWAETQLSETVAMARTQCESYDAATSVSAVFYYIDTDAVVIQSMSNSHSSNYCSIVYFSLPAGNYEAYRIDADHFVEYSMGTEYGCWSNSTSEKLK